MSSLAQAITWLEPAIVVRIDTPETGSTLEREVFDALGRLPWRLLHLDVAGAKGVLDVHSEAARAEALAQLGKITAGIRELSTVNVRDDVTLAVVEAHSPTERVAAATTLVGLIEDAGGHPVGVFIEPSRVLVAIERWRKAGLLAAL